MVDWAAYYRRRLARTDPFTIEQATLATFDSSFSALERLHEEQWQQRGGHGVLSTARDRRFHREVARRFLACKLLHLYELRTRNHLIGVFYGFAHNNRTYFYLSGFDPAYAKFSIGTILIGHAVEQTFAQGFQEFDFQRGQESHKYKWGARDEFTFLKLISKRV